MMICASLRVNGSAGTHPPTEPQPTLIMKSNTPMTSHPDRGRAESGAPLSDGAIPLGNPIAAVVRCPHCGHALTVPTLPYRTPHGHESEPTDAPMPPSPEPTPPTSHVPPIRSALGRTMDHVARTAFGDRAWQAIQTIAMVVVAVGVIGIGIGSLLQPRETTIPAASVPPISESPSAAGLEEKADSENATPASAWSAEEQAVIAALIGYNAAETEAGATLDAAPLMPYLDPDGPLAARRIASLAERRARNAPHVTMLQRWGIGAITVNGDTATVTTQETWRNQEQGEPSPRIATVRVVYTLRRSATHGWQITDATQQVLTVAP